MAEGKLTDIATRFEPKVRRALLRAFDRVRDTLSTVELTEALRMGGISGLVNTLSGMEDIISQEIADDLEAAIREGGRATIGLFPQAVILDETFRFDTFNPAAVDFIRRYELNLIQNIGANTREAVRAGVQADLIAGRNPIDTARTFRSNIGLTPHQERAVRNYRTYLETLDQRALQRALRDKRFDRTVLRAISERKPLTAAQIDRLVTRYRERYLQYRSRSIARTESLRAVSIGNQLATEQAVVGGAVDTARVRKFWVFTRDRRARDAHRAVPGMNKGGVPLDGVFRTPLGPLRFPRDPNGTAANTVQCRCTVVYRIVQAA